MRVNIYAEEMTDRVELVRKGEFTGVRFYMHLPVTLNVADGNSQVRGPFMHRPDDDDSAAGNILG